MNTVRKIATLIISLFLFLPICAQNSAMAQDQQKLTQQERGKMSPQDKKQAELVLKGLRAHVRQEVANAHPKYNDKQIDSETERRMKNGELGTIS